MPFISRRMEARLGHLEAWHSLAVNFLIAVVSLPLILVVGAIGWNSGSPRLSYLI